MLDVKKILDENSANILEQARIERRAAEIEHKKYKQEARSLRRALKELLKDPIIKSLQKYGESNQTFYTASESWAKTVRVPYEESFDYHERKRSIALTGKGFCVMERCDYSDEDQGWPIRFGRKLLFLSLYHAAKAGTTVESMKAKLRAHADEAAENEKRYSLGNLRG